MASGLAEVEKALQNLMPSLSADNVSFDRLLGSDFQKNYKEIMARFDAMAKQGLDVTEAKAKASDLLNSLHGGMQAIIRRNQDEGNRAWLQQEMLESYNTGKKAIGDLIEQAKSTAPASLAEGLKYVRMNTQQAASSYLVGAKEILAEIASHDTTRLREKKQLLSMVEKELNSHGGANIRIRKEDLNGTVAHLWAELLDKDEMPDFGSMMNPASGRREVRETAQELLGQIEYDGKENTLRKVTRGIDLGNHAGRIATGVAGVMLMGVADSWASRIKKKNHAAEMLAEMQGTEVPAAKQAGVAFKQGAAVGLGIMGMLGMFDALMNGPVSQKLQSLIGRGR